MRNLILAVVLSVVGLFGQQPVFNGVTDVATGTKIRTMSFSDATSYTNLTTFVFIMTPTPADPASLNGSGACKFVVYHYPGTSNTLIQGFDAAAGVWRRGKFGDPGVFSIGPCSWDLSRSSITYPNPRTVAFNLYLLGDGGVTKGQVTAINTSGYSIVTNY